MRRVANHNDLIAVQFFAEQAVAAFAGGNGDEIAILAVIRESARFERLPKAAMTQFDFGSRGGYFRSTDQPMAAREGASRAARNSSTPSQCRGAPWDKIWSSRKT